MEQSIGRYQVLQEIASGAQGTVYRAFDSEGGRIIALKVLHPTLSGDRTYTERFRREASLAASIDHPNVVEIFEVGTDGDRHFMALEFLPESLSGIIQSVGQLRIEGAARYAVQIADGLAAAHALGIVHRDVKPQNVLIGADGLAKVTDFGIARAESLATMTATGVVMGTPHYMSPEQSRGERADARSDVYSLGCIVYQMLAGELPFKGDTPLAVIRQQIDEDPPRLRGIRRDLPGRLESVVERAMEKDPRRRYQGTAEMAEALRAAVPGLAGPARAARHRPAPVPAPQPQPRPAPAPSPTPQAPRGPSTTFMRAWATAWRRSNRRRWAWLGTLLSVSVALTVAGVRLDGYDYVREFIGLADLSATVEEPAEGPAQIRPAEAPAPPAELAAVGKSDTNGASAVGGDATTEPKLPSAALPPATTPSAPSVPPAPTQAVIEKQVPEEVLVEQEMVETVEVPVEVEVAKEVVKPVEVPREVEAAEEVAVEPIEEPATQPTSPVSATTGPLPEDAVAFRGNSYLFVGEGMSWEEANRYAESLGGHLVTLSDEEEEAFVFELARSHGEGEFMLGLTDQANEGRFVWVTGEPMRYTNWGPSEPNNAGVTGEDFVQFEISAHGPWNDVPEFYSRFVVEFEDTPPADGLIATADQSAFTVGQRVQVNGQDVQVGGGYSSPVVVDWNNDGKKDLLVGDGQGYVSLLLNTGTDSNPLFPTEASVQAGGTALQVGQGGRDGASPFVVDWNNDGKKDLVVGDARGYVSLFLNTGTDSEPAFEAGTRVEANGNAIHLAERKPETTTGPEHGLADPFVIDWNNDGKKDLLVGNWPGYVYLFTNVGSDSAPVFAGGERIQANGTDIDFESLSPWVVDWNGDGQKDLLIGRHYGQLSGYLNAGSDSEPVFTERFDVRISTGSFISWDSDVAVADWNNDGNLDLVVGGRHGYLDLYVGNLLASGPPAVSIDSPERNSKTDSYVVTLSGAIRDSSIDHTRATVTVNGITHTAIVVQGAFTNQVVLTPGDNTIRVAATNSEGVGYDEVHINADIPAYPSFAEGFRVQAFHTDLKVEGIGASPTVVDWNGDGLKDLLVGTYNPGQISLYRNTGTQIGANNFARSEPIASGQDPIVVDWNNDGSMDLVTGGGGVRVYLNRGDDSSPVLDDPIRLGLNGRHPFVVDWDNDGRKDLLIGRDGSSGEAYINLYLNTGTDDAPAFAESSTIRANEFGIRESYGSAPYVLDWNGDGSKDLLVRESRGFYSFLNVGTDSSPLFANKIPVIADGLPLQLYSGDGTTNFSVADWNDDGVRDLVLGDYDGFIYVYLGK